MVLSMDRWSGKVAVVTGASTGIGKTIVEQLVKEGLKVVGLSRRSELVELHAEELQGEKGSLHALKVDISKPEEVVKAFESIGKTHGPVFILINNAGIMNNCSLTDGDVNLWRETFDVNVIGLSVATREAIRSMRKHGVDGHIIHINSLMGHGTNLPFFNMYPATKCAVTSLTDSLRLELREIGSKTKITSISPGLVDTPFFELKNIGHLKPPPSCPTLKSEDVADAVIYVLATPPHVQVHELILKPVGDPF